MKGSGNFAAGADLFCITDVGSTTTKAVLFEKRDGEWCYSRAEAATTVERPYEDVTVGVRHAIGMLEQQTDQPLLCNGGPAVPYLSTSSAGGGLAMVVTGLVRDITAESADRVALGAGAIVLDVLAMNDERTPYRKIEDLKRLRSDMVLLAGGFDGDAVSGPVFLAELIRESGLHPKLNPTEKLPVIYGGNAHARDEVNRALGDEFLFCPVPNIRPSGGRENLEPARNAIQDLFMDHVMSQAPGYEKLKTWTQAPILPTPAAFARVLALVSKDLGAKVLAIDLGGATTDVFTVDRDKVFRTVSANLGMSYSIRHVGEITGMGCIASLLSTRDSETELWNRIGNKHVNPTHLPTTRAGMETEWAVATLAIREAVRAHLEVIHGATLSLTRAELNITGAVRSRIKEKAAPPLLTLADYDLVIGSGGILSHSPREAAAMMLVDALQLEGQTRLAVDSAFMFPHLGVLAEIQPQLAKALFYNLGIIGLGTVLVPGNGRKAAGPVRINGITSRGNRIDCVAEAGELTVIPLEDRATVRLDGHSGADSAELPVESGVCGLIVDLRSHPPGARAHALAPADYVPQPYEVEPVAEPRIVRKRLALSRELAIPGKVFVRSGDRVEPDTEVARSEREFLRPFFLNVARSLGVPPEKLPEYLAKKIGDEIAVEEVVAKRSRHLMTPKVYRSPVAGRIEKVLPSGTLVVRERPEAARELTTVNVAKELEIDPRRAKRYLKVEVGQELNRGQWIAAVVRPGMQKVCTSPVRGRVNRIEDAYGMVIIEPLLEEVQVRAWLPGTVQQVSDRGCIVSANAIVIHGAWGRGGETFGPLVFDAVEADKITVTHFADAGMLAKLQCTGAAGVITGGLDMIDVLEPDGGPTIVVTEGFGVRQMAPDVLETLRSHDDRVALIDGATQLRVGVKRPRIILPQ